MKTKIDQYEIEWSDLSFEKHENLINWRKEVLLDEYKEEFSSRLYREKYVITSWQEVMCREMSIDEELWTTPTDRAKFDFKYAVENYAEEQAIDQLENGKGMFEV